MTESRADSLKEHSPGKNAPDPRSSVGNRQSTAVSSPLGIAVRLSPADCLTVGVLFAGLLALGPRLWDKVERFEPGENYRISANLRDDYYLFERWCRVAAARYPGVVVGDSTVWGRYTDRDSTWSAQLNQHLEKPYFANLGIDGLHNVVLVELLRHHGGAIRNRRVVLQLNPLWMTSERFDLSGAEEATSINHPRLLPQLDPTLKCYRAPLEERLKNWTERRLPYLGVVTHVSLCYLGAKSLPEWMTANPRVCPVLAIDMKIPVKAETDGQEDDTTSHWVQRNMSRQDWPWVPLDRSRQWAAFREQLDILKGRGNKVFVVVGPFNPYIMTEPCLERYRALCASIAEWLEHHHPAFHIAPDLPSEQYGDSSHPLGPGYAVAAGRLCKDKRFLAWLED